jgi:hypothetical protein
MPLFSQAPFYVRFIEALLAYFTFEVCVSVTAAFVVTAIVKHGLVAVLKSPYTGLIWLSSTIWSFRPKGFVIIVGATQDEFADKTADKVLLKAQNNGGGADAVDPELDPNGNPPPQAAQPAPQLPAARLRGQANSAVHL